MTPSNFFLYGFYTSIMYLKHLKRKDLEMNIGSINSANNKQNVNFGMRQKLGPNLTEAILSDKLIQQLSATKKILKEITPINRDVIIDYAYENNNNGILGNFILKFNHKKCPSTPIKFLEKTNVSEEEFLDSFRVSETHEAANQLSHNHYFYTENLKAKKSLL